METQKRCPECGADWTDRQTCTEYFHLLGFWELDHQLYEVHNLMVVAYHLQHPSLYSPDGLKNAMQLLVMFMEEGLTPQQVRKRIGKAVDSGTRSYKIKGTPTSFGAYAHPVHWSMTVADVAAASIENYYPMVRAWAASVLKSLRDSKNLD